jgi:hypothetical protein
MSAISILRRLVKIGTLSPSHHSEPLPFSSLRGPPFPLTVRPSLFRHCEPLPFFSLPSSCFLVIARHSSSRHCQALLFWSLPSTWFPVIARHSPSRHFGALSFSSLRGTLPFRHCEALLFSSLRGTPLFVIARHEVPKQSHASITHTTKPLSQTHGLTTVLIRAWTQQQACGTFLSPLSRRSRKADARRFSFEKKAMMPTYRQISEQGIVVYRRLTEPRRRCPPS